MNNISNGLHFKWDVCNQEIQPLQIENETEVPSLFSVVKMGEIHKQAARGEGAITCKRSRDSISALTIAVWGFRSKIQEDTLGNNVKDSRIPGKQSPHSKTGSYRS